LKSKPKFRVQTPRVSGTNNQTATRLINEARIELNSVGYLDFDVARVLKKSKASKGSLYHHFGSKIGLIIAAEAEELNAGLTQDNQVLREMIRSCTSVEDFLGVVEIALRAGVGKQAANVRRQLIRGISFANSNQDLGDKLKEISASGTGFLAESLAIAKDRGWIRQNVNLTSLAFWLQGLFIAQILGEVSTARPTEEEWLKVSLQTVSMFLTTN
jgi:AcrR family transcriptional regulator